MPNCAATSPRCLRSTPATHSARPEQIVDRSTGKPFAGNIIPIARFDAAALNLATSYLPRVTGSGDVFYSKPTKQDIDEYILRIDHRLSSRDNLTGRYYGDHVFLTLQNPAGNLLGYGAGYDQPVNNVMIQETHTFRAGRSC